MHPSSGLFLLSALLLFLFTSCKKELRSDNAENNLASQKLTSADPSLASSSAKKSDQEQLLKDVKKATSRFHSTTQAMNAGYVPDEHCVSVPGLGGMGFHWVNPHLIDAVFDPLKPEAILYAPGPNGNLRLVGLEYIVLKAGRAAAPMFGTQPFDAVGAPGLPANWSLHVWLYEDNPSGMYMPFNPNVSCQ
jgi:hypothetical protein